MMDHGYQDQAASLLRHLQAVPAYAELRAVVPDPESIAPDSLEMILDAAARFAQDVLAPINTAGDREGCRIVDGRVKTAAGYVEAWREFVAQGWNTVDQPARYGGQNLPFFVNAACRELFDRACKAFGMVPGPQRAATLTLLAYASPEMQEEWIPRFIDGSASASIGISEPGAGSDVGRIITRATPLENGRWSIEGEKMWTSFGDHDMVERIGCLLLARTPGGAPGTRGLSLFMVPNVRSDGTPNGVHVRRIEEKLGLHGSPTCVMGFENAEAELIGQVGRGLPQLFTMLQYMRLLVAIEGVGIAYGAVQTALGYARDRRQGGDPRHPPVPIADHADIQRLLLGMHSRTEVLRALLYEVAVQVDMLDYVEAEERARRDGVVQWLLPILKASCSEAGFGVPDDAIQVLGGAGYTREWPVEQWLRDARMMSIAEGSSGIQALDLLHRRLWRDKARDLHHFLAAARAEIGEAAGTGEAAALAVLAKLEEAAVHLVGLEAAPREAEAGATAFLRLAILAATGWMAVRLSRLAGNPVSARLAAAGHYWLSDLVIRADLEVAELRLGAGRLDLFAQL